MPHPFRSDGDPGVLYWGDSVSPEEHGDGFTDTLIDYAGVGVVTLDYSAGRNFPNANGPPVTYASLTVTQKTSAQSWFRDHYAKEYFGASSYNALTAAQQLRIPPYDTVAPLPVATDRERLAIHVYGVGFDSLTTVEQDAITSAIAAPSASFYIQDARQSVWYCKVDDDLIAHHNFGKFHDQLTAGEQEQIRLLNANVASYRTGKSSPYSVFSEQQLDRMCDIISQSTDGQFDASAGGASGGGFSLNDGYWTRVVGGGPPLTIILQPGGTALLQWQANAAGWRLESSVNLAGWAPMGGVLTGAGTLPITPSPGTPGNSFA